MHHMARRKRHPGGRLRKTGERYPSGGLKQPEREPTGASPETLARRSDALCSVISAHPHMLALKLAKDPDAEWYIGRLFLCEVLTRRQRDAGDRYRKAIATYRQALCTAFGGPVDPRAMDLDRVAGRLQESDARLTRRFRRARREYDQLFEALSADRDVLRTVTAALRDEDVRLDWLRRGLDVLDGV